MSSTAPDSSALTVAILPDSFKGSASAGDVAEAMERGVRSAGAAGSRPIRVEALPFADGGEGTLDAICSAWSVAPLTAEVTDALGRPATARYAVSQDGRIGVVEAAEANGLPRVSDVPAQPLHAGTYGVGLLVGAVLDAGCEEILLCIGGSATTDGGAGLVQALGGRLLDAQGRDLPAGGEALAALERIDLDDLDPRVRALRWRIACDVTNPLLGENGAAAVFGPQKGATPADIETLDAGLARFADVLERLIGREVREQPGTGAAGGMPLALVSLFGAEIVPGGTLVAETLGAPDLLESADLVLTGEGRLDSQSLQGKVVDTVRRMTPAATPVVVVAGSVELTGDQLRACRVNAAFSIAAGPQSLHDLQSRALERIEATSEQVMGVYLGATAARQ